MSTADPARAGATRGVSARPTVVVVGGGIAGLSAAWELTGGARANPEAPRVVLLEASSNVGGALRSEELMGEPVDTGPDGFLARRPETRALCEELGLEGRLEPVASTGAAVWVRGRRRALPRGLVLGVPTALLPVARSGILGPSGTVRLAMDRLLPRPDRRGPLDDRAVGPLVARKLGHQVVDHLVDPLVGGIHAGGVEDMSAAADFPALLAAVRRRGSFMRALRQVATADGPTPDLPAFLTLDTGIGSLPATLAAALERRGVEIHTGAPVSALIRAGSEAGGPPRWRVVHPGGGEWAEGIVLSVPAPAAASLLAQHASEAARILRGIELASVHVATFAFPAAAVPGDLEGTGVLVPRSAKAPIPGSSGASGAPGPFLVTACTYLSRKWTHLARQGVVLLRASAGRLHDDRAQGMDQDALLEGVRREIAILLGVTGSPLAARVTRWPSALPQYRVHHLLRVAAIEAAVARLPALRVAGSAYHGIGVPACVGSGRLAGAAVLGAVRRG